MWWADKWRPVVGCILNLTLNIILVKTIGMAGVMLSTIISYALVEMPWETHVLFKHYFKNAERHYYTEMIIATLGIIVAGLVTYTVCELISINHITAILIKLAICIFLPNAIFILQNYRNKEFKRGLQFVSNIVNGMNVGMRYRNWNRNKCRQPL